MLTSSNQYLRPEYLTPLPTTLDAKKSPLALLAQTCSQIGADCPNTKLLQSSEKSSKKSSSSSTSSSSEVRDKSSPASSNTSSIHSESIAIGASNNNNTKASFKPYDVSVREKTRSPEERANSSGSHQSSGNNRVRTPVSATGGGAGSKQRCASNQSATSKTPTPEGNNQMESSTRMSPSVAKSLEASTRTSTPTSSALYTNATSSSKPSSFSPTVLTTSSSSSSDSPLGSFKPTVSAASVLGYPGLSLQADLMAATSLHQLKGGLSPYLSYARMKGPTGADSLVPVCRDPYCTGCSLSSHLKSPCPAGCVQCDHASKGPAAAPGYLSFAHAQLAALAAASQLPYVCNWIASDASYCGKRFSSSEELLQHLRTHTSVSTAEMITPVSHPLLHRTYPTPPLSPLATARFHPYSKPALLPPSLASTTLGFPPLGHPGLPPYFSPYSLYGPRLGAASSMHP